MTRSHAIRSALGRRLADAVARALYGRPDGSQPAGDWTPPPHTDKAMSPVEQLMLLVDLKDAGFLTREELAAERRKVIGP